jgi:hypothetical protein
MEFSKLIQIFYKNVIESSTDEELDDNFEVLMHAEEQYNGHAQGCTVILEDVAS